MGRKGQKSVQYGFKVTEELADKIEKERIIDGTTLAGFFNDAIKFYIEHRENRRLELWKMEKEQAEKEAVEENFDAEPKVGGGATVSRTDRPMDKKPSEKQMDRVS